MKIKTSELTGAALDWAVAKCENEPEYLLNKPWRASELLSQYSTDWAQGGPIIEREKISVIEGFNDEWQAGKRPHKFSYGPTPLIAAMRCYVASKLGAEVDVPLAIPQQPKDCQHSWTEESRQNGWRSSCRLCGKEAAGSGQ